MIEFDRNSKRDLELKSEYDEMVLKMKEQEIKLKNEYDEKLKEQLKQNDIKIKNKQIEIAKNLLNNNVDVEIIISSTGLSKEEIENLK